jgi:DNA-binding transcriptional regulator YdaS (Cro superfamily)
MKKNEAIKHYGGVVQLAAALGIKPQSVSQWGDTIPQGRAYQIELLTGGKLKAGAHSTPQQPTPCV